MNKKNLIEIVDDFIKYKTKQFTISLSNGSHTTTTLKEPFKTNPFKKGKGTMFKIVTAESYMAVPIENIIAISFIMPKD